MNAPPQPPKPRSKRIYVLWGVALKDKDLPVRQAAAEALKKIKAAQEKDK